ncbi:hypothetical protein C8035_v002480 [Colletotrichum spinosum]|uniref:Uncharacterized protein n=1 Tax=Colletotrichum spinosum TaxID=1347390 RepID=A0A4R8PXI6_9PEZI|nr:hypothetical protein C8035_v002480 [Colletotrichum spinosum]
MSPSSIKGNAESSSPGDLSAPTSSWDEQVAGFPTSDDINPPLYNNENPHGRNGPACEGAQASGVRGGHHDTTGNTSSKGGRAAGGSFGHHSGSPGKSNN